MFELRQTSNCTRVIRSEKPWFIEAGTKIYLSLHLLFCHPTSMLYDYGDSHVRSKSTTDTPGLGRQAGEHQ